VIRLVFGWAPLAVWLAAIWWQSSRSGGPAPIDQGAWFVVTSLGHVVEYAGLGFLGGRLLVDRSPRWAWFAAWTLCLLWGISDELHQSFVPGRDVDLWDVGVDGVSAAAGLLACRLLRRVRPLPWIITRATPPPRA